MAATIPVEGRLSMLTARRLPLLLLAACAAGGAGSASFDGRYAGTGETLEGSVTTCGPRATFPVQATVRDGRFEMRLARGSLVGAVGEDGRLDAIRWAAGGVQEQSEGRIAGSAAEFTYRFRWNSQPSEPACSYRYSLRRQD
jgi:hypothetical protein